ncbi:SLC13 family permease [Streptomyces iconiensis]|uniref:ArsB/NhaD family transporter n=1 Tax=Streptomyces iconiensis TaxID=1384038 RepID=A0ABT7A222_9ACTN|nr:SLC13 family permease [Streptomyces iconiensis]MDJ1135367.1 ArsB/NhaD family transporter [Streptomyces iconiensis]
MSAPQAEALSATLLAAVLIWAVARPQRWSEAVVAVPAAALVIATGAISLAHARDEAARLAPVIGFLAAVLVLARLCADEGLFHACGAWMAKAAAGGGGPRRLLAAVFVLASLTTAVLSLDTTVVLLTPVVFATAARLGIPARPHVYACAHLSNSASLLLPVSNLTNLLAFAASGLSFARFAGLMALPWAVAIAVEYVVFRRFFAADLTAAPIPDRADGRTGGLTGGLAGGLPHGSADGSAGDPADGPGAPDLRKAGSEGERFPLFPLFTVAGTLAGFLVTSAFGLDPVWAAAAGALALGVRAMARGHATPRGVVRAAGLPFLAFVLSLGVVVRAVVDHGLADWLGRALPDGTGLWALLGVAALAAVLANVINNLPAVLVLLPLTAHSGPGAVLAVLLGVNIGPNLTYAGSLATLLWRQALHQHAHSVRLREFTRLGMLTVPPALALAVVALWGSLRVLGG